MHLFDDGVLPKPRDRYNFGLAADAIFRPCNDDEGCPLDPHLYLDDAFCENEPIDAYVAASAEREALGGNSTCCLRDERTSTSGIIPLWRRRDRLPRRRRRGCLPPRRRRGALPPRRAPEHLVEIRGRRTRWLLTARAPRPRTVHPRGGGASRPRTIHVAPRGGAASRRNVGDAPQYPPELHVEMLATVPVRGISTRQPRRRRDPATSSKLWRI